MEGFLDTGVRAILPDVNQQSKFGEIMSEQNAATRTEQHAPGKKVKNPHVWPDLPFMELMCMVVITIVLIVWSIWLDAPLGEIATPSRTENPAKAPWYFVGLQEILVYFDPWYAGVVLPTIIIVGLMAIPYLDVNPKGVGEYNFSVRKFAVFNFLFGYLLWMGAIVVGEFMRGPSWFFFWPWEPWDPNYHPVAVELRNFSTAVGLGSIIVYFALFFGVPVIFRMRLYKGRSFIRYMTLMSLMALLYLVPIKIILRQVFNVRYVLVTPWFNI